mmetsp:Transcript_17338/g.27024  ORF Transcript_17338/g.27024 Transcript_17338/m.27024 type:complete len:367 (+) Transcript_17338:711-1811(+)
MVAMKILDKGKILAQNMGSQIKREISIMKVFSHPRIVKLKEVLASKTKIYLILELVTGGELFDEIVRDTRFPEEKARYYFQQLVAGVEYCHGKGVCHRDLKPENLLLDEDNNLKISDFGLSALYTGEGDDPDESFSSRKNLLHTTCGTPSYVAPEILDDEGYNGQIADIWSMGVILYVLVAGCLPFDEHTLPALFDKIQKANYLFPPFFSLELRDLISKILVVDPKKRLTLKEIQAHPWFLGEKENGLNDSISSINQSVDYSIDSTGSGRSNRKSMRVSRIKSNDTPEELTQKLMKCLKEMECDVTEHGNKIKASRMTSKGMIGITIQIGADSLVEVRRGKGDIMEYQNFYNELVGERMGLVGIAR